MTMRAKTYFDKRPQMCSNCAKCQRWLRSVSSSSHARVTLPGCGWNRLALSAPQTHPL